MTALERAIKLREWARRALDVVPFGDDDGNRAFVGPLVRAADRALERLTAHEAERYHWWLDRTSPAWYEAMVGIYRERPER